MAAGWIVPGPAAGGRGAVPDFAMSAVDPGNPINLFDGSDRFYGEGLTAVVNITEKPALAEAGHYKGIPAAIGFRAETVPDLCGVLPGWPHL